METKVNKIPIPAKVGLFDSGVGGISVLNEIRKLLPSIDLLYVADSAHVPYGEKSPNYIKDRSRKITRFLVSKKVNAIVVACNTATAAAISDLRREFVTPFIGMEPAVKPAIAATRSGIVGVLATTGTLASAKFAALLERYKGDREVITEPCPGWVNAVESGKLSDLEVEDLVRRHVEPLVKQGADVLILGCTHYPFLKPFIEKIAGPSVTLVDTGTAVAKQLRLKLADIGYDSMSSQLSHLPAATVFFTSGDPIQAQPVMSRLSQERIPIVEQLPAEFI